MFTISIHLCSSGEKSLERSVERIECATNYKIDFEMKISDSNIINHALLLHESFHLKHICIVKINTLNQKQFHFHRRLCSRSEIYPKMQLN